MRRIILSFIPLMAVPMSAFADFEGTIHMKVTGAQGGGKMTIAVSKAGVRSDIDMKAGDMPMKMSVLVKSSNPDVGYTINESGKTYSEIDLKRAKEMAKQRQASSYTAKKIGNEKVVGYDAVHSIVSDSNGTTSDVWTVKGLMDVDTMMKVMHQGPTNEGMMHALKEAGADGFIVKMVHKEKAGGETTMELVDLDKKTPPASLFEIPAGYTKSQGGFGALPPEAQEKIKEKMKNMTPEQREALMKMMQQKAKPKE